MIGSDGYTPWPIMVAAVLIGLPLLTLKGAPLWAPLSFLVKQLFLTSTLCEASKS